MGGTILSIVHGECSSRGKWRLILVHSLGSIAGGAGLGALIGWTGQSLASMTQPLSGPTIAWLLGAVSGWLALRDFGVIRLPLPESHWQVPRMWQRRMPLPLVMLLYGTTLGAGVFTRIPASGFYVVLLGLLLARSPLDGAIVCGLYGVARVAPLLALYGTTRDLGSVWASVLRVPRWSAAIGVANGIILALSAGWLIGAVLTRVR